MKKQLSLTSIDGKPKRLKLREWKPREADFQRDLFDWAKRAEGHYPELAFMYAVPNGAVAGPGRFQTVAWMKNQGMKRGVPDVVLPAMRCQPIGLRGETPRYWPGLYAELKTDVGVISLEQQAWHEYFEAAGYMMTIWRELNQAIDAIKFYLDLPRPDWVATTVEFKGLRDQLNKAALSEDAAAQMRRNKRRMLGRIS